MWQRLGDYRRAAAELKESQNLLPAGLALAEATLIDVLAAENTAITNPQHRCDDIEAAIIRHQANPVSPSAHELIAYADCAARRHIWPIADEYLDRASTVSGTDDGLRAYVECRRANILIQRAFVDGPNRSFSASQAIGYAAQAISSYRSIGSADGEFRARVSLAWAYLAHDQIGECVRQTAKAWSYVNTLPEPAFEYARLLCGQLYWVQGEAKIRSQQGDQAIAELEKSIEIFADCQDSWRISCARLALGKAYRMLGRATPAMSNLYTALEVFEQNGDVALGSQIWNEIREVRKLEDA